MVLVQFRLDRAISVGVEYPEIEHWDAECW